MSNETVAKHLHLNASRRMKTASSPGTAQLSYFIFEGVLTGYIGADFYYNQVAVSGGAAGSRDSPANRKHGFIKAAPHTDDANNPYRYAVQENAKSGTRGGPVPPGSYTIHPPGLHINLGPSAKLTIPAGQHQVNHRDGFYIHGQGPKGSDGCIVLQKPALDSLLEKLRKSGGGHLQVFQAMDAAFV